MINSVLYRGRAGKGHDLPAALGLWFLVFREVEELMSSRRTMCLGRVILDLRCRKLLSGRNDGASKSIFHHLAYLKGGTTSFTVL